MDIETKIRLNNIKASIEHDGSDHSAECVKFVIDLLHAEQVENARLQSVIDEVASQLPLTTVQVLQGYPRVVSHAQCSVKDGIYKVYALLTIGAQGNQIPTK